MDPSGLGPGSQAYNRMSIAYLAPARRDPSPGYPRAPSRSISSFADAHNGAAARATASNQSNVSNLPPGFKQTTAVEAMKDAQDDALNGSVAPSSYGDSNEDGDTSKSSTRDPRPSYTEEQKFFIMWARIVQEKGWPDIENRFEAIWGHRTKGGLTSVYYRIRKGWKLKDVLCTDASSSEADRQAVAKRARNFSGEFLRIIDYGD